MCVSVCLCLCACLPACVWQCVYVRVAIPSIFWMLVYHDTFRCTSTQVWEMIFAHAPARVGGWLVGHITKNECHQHKRAYCFFISFATFFCRACPLSLCVCLCVCVFVRARVCVCLCVLPSVLIWTSVYSFVRYKWGPSAGIGHNGGVKSHLVYLPHLAYVPQEEPRKKTMEKKRPRH